MRVIWGHEEIKRHKGQGAFRQTGQRSRSCKASSHVCCGSRTQPAGALRLQFEIPSPRHTFLASPIWQAKVPLQQVESKGSVQSPKTALNSSVATGKGGRRGRKTDLVLSSLPSPAIFPPSLAWAWAWPLILPASPAWVRRGCRSPERRAGSQLWVSSRAGGSAHGGENRSESTCQ